MQSTLRKFLQGISLERAVIAALILLGVALRLRQYLALRSFWLDEAMLALNIVGRSFSGLLKPLDYNQGGPVGFLLAEKMVVNLLGNSELSLRLIDNGVSVPQIADCDDGPFADPSGGLGGQPGIGKGRDENRHRYRCRKAQLDYDTGHSLFNADFPGLLRSCGKGRDELHRRGLEQPWDALLG